MAIYDTLEEFEKKLGYTFKDKALLRLALTHKSYAYEHDTIDKGLFNERIEYLGDAILEHIISDLLYYHTPTLNEGNMSKKRAEIVCEKSLSEAFSTIDGDKYIFVGKCEKLSGKKREEAIIADAFEAVLGAIYIDGGFEIASNIARKLLKKQIEDSLSGKTKITDYKTKLQEFLQKDGRVGIKYKVEKEMGPDHDKVFFVNVFVNGKKEGNGIGKNRKEAEQEAAKVAYEKLK